MTENSALPFGIDISSYQFSKDGSQKPNFDVINARCKFVAVRAGISWGYIDRWFSYSWQNIVVPRLAYHVVYPAENAIRQMDHFLNIVRPTSKDRLVLDMELDHGQSKEKITETLLQCLVYIRENTGRYPVVYSRADWVNRFLYVSQLPDLDWWLAHYLRRVAAPAYTPEKASPPTLPKGITRWLIHQTGERGNGTENGVASHYVDTNRWNGSSADIQAYFGFTEQPDPDPDPEKLFDAKVYSWATPYVNVRKYPRIASEDLGNVYPNETVPVYEVVTNPNGEEWYRIPKGWVMAKYLQRLDFTPPATLLDIQPLSQKDPRWGDKYLGNSYLRIRDYGCLATDFAMYLGVGVDEFNDRLKSVGGFSGANIYWKAVELAYPQLKYEKAIDCFYVPAPLPEIDALLERQIPVMVHVDYNPATLEVEQHWVMIVGNLPELDDYLINDPIDGKRVSFRSRYGAPARYIFRIRAYSKGVA